MDYRSQSSHVITLHTYCTVLYLTLKHQNIHYQASCKQASFVDLITLIFRRRSRKKNPLLSSFSPSHHSHLSPLQHSLPMHASVFIHLFLILFFIHMPDLAESLVHPFIHLIFMGDQGSKCVNKGGKMYHLSRCVRCMSAPGGPALHMICILRKSRRLSSLLRQLCCHSFLSKGAS